MQIQSVDAGGQTRKNVATRIGINGPQIDDISGQIVRVVRCQHVGIEGIGHQSRRIGNQGNGVADVVDRRRSRSSLGRSHNMHPVKDTANVVDRYRIIRGRSKRGGRQCRSGIRAIKCIVLNTRYKKLIGRDRRVVYVDCVRDENVVIKSIGIQSDVISARIYIVDIEGHYTRGSTGANYG